MKHSQHTTPEQAELPLSEICRWPLRLRELHQRLRSHFARSETYKHALLYLQAIWSRPSSQEWLADR